MRVISCIAAVCLLPALVCAQGTFNLDKATPGTVGANLVLNMGSAPANSVVLLMVSTTSGPTPISSYDPTDPRVLSVGTDLTANWPVLASNASGALQVSVAVPNDPTLANVVLNWQAAVPGTVSLVGPISNPIRTQLSIAGTALLAPAALVTPRSIAAGFSDPNENAGGGDFLLAGGGGGALTGGAGLQTSEFWDFRRMVTRPGPNLSRGRALALSVRLADGRVLLTGGTDATGAVTATCDLYDPTTNTFTATGSMAAPRAMHAAVRLADGRVMVAGGTRSLVDQTSILTNVLSSVEFWNPTTGLWTNGPALSGLRLAPALTRLPDNRILVTGGVQVTLLLGVPVSAASTVATQYWNPATNAWTNGPGMPTSRAGHHLNQVTMQDGRILFTGGLQMTDLLNAANAAPTPSCQAYNPATNTWQNAGFMPTARILHTAHVLPNGNVVLCGGAQGTLSALVPTTAVSVFDPVNFTWTALSPLQAARCAHASVQMPDGTIVLLGGQGLTGTEASIETLRF